MRMLGSGEWRNWAGNQQCSPKVLERPRTAHEIAQALERARAHGLKVRVAGAGHSFTPIVATDGVLLSLDAMNQVLDVDAATGRVKVEAGIRLFALNEALTQRGLAMANLGDINVQSLAGALSTATHGTGARLPNLSAQVVELEVVAAEGTIHRFGEGDPDGLKAARVAVGSLGVIATATLQCVPRFTLEAIEQPAPAEEVLEQLESRATAEEHFEFFLFPHAKAALTRTNRRSDKPPAPRSKVAHWLDDILLKNHALGAICRLGRARPSWIPALNRLVTKVAGSSHKVDESHRIFASPRLVRFEEMEYAIPRDAGAHAIREVLRMIQERQFAVNFPLEVRFVAPDDAFLSPSFERPTCYVAVHMFEGMPFEPFFRAVEEIMNAHGGRPHWGKRHFQTAKTLATRYPRWRDFQAVRARMDPLGMFTTPAIETVLGPVGE